MFSQSNNLLLYSWLLDLYGRQSCEVQVFYGATFTGVNGVLAETPVIWFCLLSLVLKVSLYICYRRL